MAIEPDDLEPIEVTLLGVLSLGLPPSRAAGDDRFRVDHITAVTMALREGAERERYLLADGLAASPGFRESLRAAVASLREKGLVAQQAAGMPAPPGGFEAGLQIDLVNPDEHPVLLDRRLGQECMEVLLREPAVYPYLMERYARAGEVWRRLRESGYGS